MDPQELKQAMDRQAESIRMAAGAIEKHTGIVQAVYHDFAQLRAGVWGDEKKKTRAAAENEIRVGRFSWSRGTQTALNWYTVFTAPEPCRLVNMGIITEAAEVVQFGKIDVGMTRTSMGWSSSTLAANSGKTGIFHSGLTCATQAVTRLIFAQPGMLINQGDQLAFLKNSTTPLTVWGELAGTSIIVTVQI